MGEGVKTKLAMVRSHPTLTDPAKRQLLDAVQKVIKLNLKISDCSEQSNFDKPQLSLLNYSTLGDKNEEYICESNIVAKGFIF